MRRDVKRRRALASYAILDTDPEPAFTGIASLAREIFGVSFAAISFLDDERQWFKAGCGLDIRETPIEQSFCKLASARDEVFVVTDARLDPRFCANPLVLLDPKIRFYAVMRVTATDGTPIGALCVLDTKPRAKGIEASRVFRRLLSVRRSYHEQDKEQVFT